MINEFVLASPLITISVLSILLLMVDAFIRNKNVVYWGSVFFLLAFIGVSAYALSICPADSVYIKETYAGEHLSFGVLPYVFDILFGIAGLIAVLSAKEYNGKAYKNFNEFYSLILLSMVGMVVISHSNSLLMIFLGIELMSIVFYVLAGFFRDKLSSIEAGLKYFFLGSFASAFLLLGIAFLYGSSGSIYFNHISHAFQTGAVVPVYYNIGMALLIIGFAFKVAAFPLHQWAPDVYYGSPTISAGFLSTAGKVAALAGLVVVFKNFALYYSPTQELTHTTFLSREILAYISAATMLIGNITALSQTNVKRMLAYSSVAHAGYLLMGIVANSAEGYSAVAYYSMAYIFMQAGAFAILSVLENKEGDNLDFENFKNLRATHPVLAAIMTCFMLSLAGIPPFGGFFGKYFLFISAMEAGFVWLTIVAVIASIISMYFYIKLILNMYFKQNDTPIGEVAIHNTKIAIAICIIGIIAIGVYPNLFNNLLIR